MLRLAARLVVASALVRGAQALAAPRAALGDASALADASLMPVSGGALSGPAVRGAALWEKRGALVFVVRRPG